MKYDGSNEMELRLLETDPTHDVASESERISGVRKITFLSLDEYNQFSNLMIPGKVFIGYYPPIYLLFIYLAFEFLLISRILIISNVS